MHRSIQPEILDDLPRDHPDQVPARRDLKWINRVMGNFRWFARRLPPLLRPGDRVLEIGAGDGGLARRLHPMLPPGVTWHGLDRAPRPADWPTEWMWTDADLREYSDAGEHPVIIGNLILHHFTDPELAELGTRFKRARALAFCEPWRRRSFLKLAPLLHLVRLHPLSHHDVKVSIRAGFVPGELPTRLGLSPSKWTCKEETGWIGAYRLVTEKVDIMP